MVTTIKNSYNSIVEQRYNISVQKLAIRGNKDFTSKKVTISVTVTNCLIKIPYGQIQQFPDVGLGEVRHHLLGKDPVGHRGALNDLSLQ